MDWPSEITASGRRIQDYIRITPVLKVDMGMPRPVELKLEHLQHTGSFKARGAFNTLLSEQVPAAGLAAASGGNHGAAVAYAAASLGYKAQIFVPEIAGPEKIALIERQGATLQIVPGTYGEALSAAKTYIAETGAMEVSTYDSTPTVAGQGTCMAEWEAQGLEADTVLIAVGGGGLIAGAMAWLGNRRKVVAVEPEACPTLHAALASGASVDISPSGIAANALGARRIGSICFDMAQTLNTQSLLVSDNAIKEAQVWLWENLRLLVEPSGAAALAALTSGRYTPQTNERVAVLLCGANTAPDPFAKDL